MPRAPIALLALAAVPLFLMTGCGDDDGGGETEDATAYCAAVVEGQASLGGDVQDPVAAQAAVEAFDRLVETAPPSIEEDVRTIADLVDQIAAADPADEDGVADLFAAALDPEFLAASSNVQEFTRVQCGIDLGGASPSLTTP
jgi:hypothetical protein